MASDARSRFWRVGVVATTAALLACLGLWFSSPTVGVADRSRPEGVRGALPRDPGEQADGAASITSSAPEVCDAERAALAVAASVARDLCEESLRSVACYPPPPYPEGFHDAETIQATYRQLLTDCGELPSGSVVLDCAEFPCILVVRRDVLREPDCQFLTELAGVAQPPAEIQQYGATWSEWAPFSTEDMPDPGAGELASIAHARYEARMRTLASAIEVAKQRAGADFMVGIKEPPCTEIAATLSALQSADPCTSLRTHWGCTEVPERAIPVKLAKDHEEAARARIESLAGTCKELAATTYLVDCTSIPCLFGFLPVEGQKWNETLCNDGLAFDGVRSISPGPGLPTVVIAALWEDTVEENPAVLERWRIEEMMRAAALARRVAEATEEAAAGSSTP